MYMNECTNLCTHLHCYVISLYIILVTHTHTHTHTYTHTHIRNTHIQTGLVPYAVTLDSNFSHCFHRNAHNTHTHTCSRTVHFALLCKWNLVHNTYIHSCTVHLYTRTLTHTYIALKVCSAKLVICTCTCILFHLTAVFNFCTLSF